MSDDHWRFHPWQDRDIAWRTVGTGPPLVLCHGTPWSSVVWEPLVERLSAERTVYLWDMPGYGRSSKSPDHCVGLTTQGQALVAMLEHWGLERPDLVAHDYGGAVALRAHLLHGCDLNSLLLADVVTLRPWGSDFFALVREGASTFERLPAPMHRALLEAYIQGASHRVLDAPVREQLLAPWLGADGQKAFYAQIAQADQAHTDPVVERLARVRCRTRILWGSHDAWIPVEQAHRLAAAIPGARATVIQQAGHLVQLDAPEDFARVTRAWLTNTATQ